MATVACALAFPATAGAYVVEPSLTRVAGVETRCYTPGELVWRDGAGAPIGGYYSDDPPRIGLAPYVCRRIGRVLDGDRTEDAWTVTLRAYAWHTFAHEVAHHRGYDHGERTIGADCAGWRMLPGLLRVAGVEQPYRGMLHRRATPYARCR